MQMTWHCTLRYKPDSDLQSSLNAIVACSDQWQLSVSSKQEGLAVASIAWDDPSTLPSDDHARMHRDRNAR